MLSLLFLFIILNNVLIFATWLDIVLFSLPAIYVQIVLTILLLCVQHDSQKEFTEEQQLMKKYYKQFYKFVNYYCNIPAGIYSMHTV